MYKVLGWTSKWTVHKVSGLTFVCNCPQCDDISVKRIESCTSEEELIKVIKEIEDNVLTHTTV
jgi:hypothetical protein